MRALLRKEFLETIRWWPLALLLNAGLVGLALYSPGAYVILYANTLLRGLTLGGPIVALAFGLLQSFPDERVGARAYLLHRGVTARQVFWSKTMVGATLYLASVLIPLAGAAVWLESQGPQHRAARWIQVLPAAVAAIGWFALHPAAVLVACRQARWTGSRLIPLAGAACYTLALATALRSSFARWELTLIFSISVAVVATYLLAAQHAYTQLAQSPPPASHQSSRASTTVCLFASTLCTLLGVSGAVGWFVLSVFSPPRNSEYYETVVDTEGQPWLVTVTNEWSEEDLKQTRKVISGCRMVPNANLDPAAPLPADWEERITHPLRSIGSSRYSGDIAFAQTEYARRFQIVYDRRGYLLYYDPYVRKSADRLSLVAGADGLRAAQDAWGAPFQTNHTVQATPVLGLLSHYFSIEERLFLACYEKGIYQIDLKSKQLRPLADGPVDLVGAFGPVDPRKSPPQLFVASESEIRVFELIDQHGGGGWAWEQEGLPQLQSRQIDSVLIPPQLRGQHYLGFAYLGKGHWSMWLGWPGYRFAISRPGEEVAEFYVNVPELNPTSMGTIALTMPVTPPAFALTVGAASYLQRTGWGRQGSLAEMVGLDTPVFVMAIVIVLWQAAVAMALTAMAARNRDLATRRTAIWLLVALFAGIATPASLLVVYPRCIRDRCEHCGKPRRVDLPTCEHCQASWAPPPRIGIEIVHGERHAVDLTENAWPR